MDWVETFQAFLQDVLDFVPRLIAALVTFVVSLLLSGLNQQMHSLFDVHSMVLQAIVEAAEREGIDLPYPIQTVRLEGEWPGHPSEAAQIPTRSAG
jgi:small-conductance mechanosensitive channel